MGVRILHLVRHGQYQRAPERLTALGRAQAECVAARLSEEPLHALHTSMSPRAVETAEPLGRTLPDLRVRRTRVLMEGIPTMPRWEMPPEMGARFGNPPEGHFEREVRRLRKAVSRFVRATRGPDRHEVLFFHGNWIRAFVCEALDLPLAAWWDMTIHHCSVTSIEVRGTRSVIARLNDTGHLPKGLRTHA